MADHEWARTTLSVWAGADEQHMDLPGNTLAEQLAQAEQRLLQLVTTPTGQPAAHTSVRLFSSWTPREGHNAMTLPPGLIKVLAAVNGTFWLDAYPTEPEEQTRTK